MFPLAARVLAVALVTLPAAVTQQPAPAAPQRGPSDTTFPCDADGVIRCSFQEVETVTGLRSLEDMRVISKYIQLVSERNRRYYIAWHNKLPSAAFELVKRIKAFPYVPYGDTYAIVGMDIVLQQSRDRVLVRYPKRPKQDATAPVPESEHVVYDAKLSDFIKDLQKEIEKLKKYEKPPGAFRH